MQTLQSLTSTFTPTIFTWDFYCDFNKIKTHTFKIKVFLNILNSLLGEKDIEKNSRNFGSNMAIVVINY